MKLWLRTAEYIHYGLFFKVDLLSVSIKYIQNYNAIFFMPLAFGLDKVKFGLFFGNSLIKMSALISALKGTLNQCAILAILLLY